MEYSRSERHKSVAWSSRE